MKSFYPLLLTVLLGCSKYQIFDTKTTDSKIENNVFETDTVKITYYFWEDKGVMAFSIHNKLSKPIYIDWKNSSFIHNGQKFDYWSDEIQTSGSSLTTSKSNLAFYNSYYRGFWYNGGGINSVSVQTSNSNSFKPERITFIPPKSSYSRSSFTLSNAPFSFDKRKEKTLEFGHGNSPAIFRNYLAMSMTEKGTNYSFVDNEFYVVRVQEIKQRAFSKMGKIPTAFYIEIKPKNLEP